MPRIDELFKPHTATAAGFNRYKSGDVAYVTNGFRNNGVIGYVKPRADDEVFGFHGIAVSAFCEATLQFPPFIARGNGGSGLIVLEPLKPMTDRQLAHIAAYINTVIRWRFSWSRLATVDRLGPLNVPPPNGAVVDYAVRRLLPQLRERRPQSPWRATFRPFPLDSLFEMKAGDYHSTAEVRSGDIPLISCGTTNNGICAFVDVPAESRYRYKLTIAFNGMNTLVTKFHPYEFAAKDDVAVCAPRKHLRTSTLFFVQMMMAREQWRYSFYRKCLWTNCAARVSRCLPAAKASMKM